MCTVLSKGIIISIDLCRRVKKNSRGDFRGWGAGYCSAEAEGGMRAPGCHGVPGREGQRYVHPKENFISAISRDTSPIPSYTCKF